MTKRHFPLHALFAGSIFGCLLVGAMGSTRHATQDAKLAPYTLTLPGSVVKIRMVPVPGGKITIRGKEVTVKPFYIAETETPWEAMDVFLLSGPPSKPYDQTKFPPDAVARPSRSYILPDLGWGHHGYPVIDVSFDNVDMFCRWLKASTMKHYRLPTEAEYEFACRNGSSAPFKVDPSKLGAIAWYVTNSAGTTHPIETKLPNKLGLFDMLGNVGEWATDLDGKPVLCGAAYNDPASAVSPTTRKYWTPAWQEEDPQLPKSRWWLSNGSFVGFRIVCEP